MHSRGAYLTRMMAVNVAAAIVVFTAFGGIDRNTPWPLTLRAFGIALLFAMCTGPLLMITMPRLGRLVWGRFSRPVNWAVMILAMIVLAATGCAIAIAVLVALGVAPPVAFVSWFARSLRIAIIVTLIFGISVTAYELLRARLEETTLALRTKERDEAEARRLASEAQLASLESRVQPHFLFNTLNSIAALIPTDPAGAERMTGQLASLLRSSLDLAASPVVTLEQELATVRDYLEIERVRFGNRLRYSIDVPQVLYPRLLPRMAIQTLVENSVKYAVSPRRDGASLAIRATGHDDRLRVDVTDDGPGFDAAALPEQHGLALLQQRLMLSFGASARLDVVRTAAGVTVSIDVGPPCEPGGTPETRS